LEARRALGASQLRRYRHIANSRIAAATLLGLVGWLGSNDPAVLRFVAVPFALFVFLVLWHARVGRAFRRAERAAGYYERRLACLDDRWAGQGVTGTRYLDERHPNAPDLDLFGVGCLFELLSSARTRAGEDALADWLLRHAALEEIEARQAAVAELRPNLDLREDLALLGADVPDGVDLEALAQWGQTRLLPFSLRVQFLALALVTLSVATLIGWFSYNLSGLFVGIALFLQSGFAFWQHRHVREVLAAVEKRAQDLALLAGLLRRVERQPVACPRLVQLRATLDTVGEPPSVRIARLVRLVDWLNSRHNMFFAPIAALLLWGTQLAFAIEVWRRTSGPAIARWLATVGEFEALCTLAAYSFEHPADPFPELVRDGPCYNALGLGHPLLPQGQCVRNDVRLGGELRLLVVSGSNMSGKSTLLRTVGINAVLAFAGAPVRATQLRISALTVGATLRIQDSLQAGRSRFYTEITRVRQLLDLAKGTPPLLFLLDELLQGTNSHDRRLGAEAVVRSLVQSGAIGLITTHDLALTQITDLLGARAANVHFEDQFENGVMTFDYRMREGVVRNSNALALMRAVGIEV
jgi:hypothetical protein